MRRLCAGPSLRHRSFRTLRRHPSGLYTFSRRRAWLGIAVGTSGRFPRIWAVRSRTFPLGWASLPRECSTTKLRQRNSFFFSPPPPHPLPRTRMFALYAPELPTEFSSTGFHCTGFCHVCFFSEWGGLLVLSGSSSVRPKWHERPFGERKKLARCPRPIKTQRPKSHSGSNLPVLHENSDENIPSTADLKGSRPT